MEMLRTESLQHVRDGELAGLIDSKLAEMFADCVDRPRLETARKLTLTISVKPTGEDPIERADVDFAVKSSLPAVGFTRQMKASAKHRGLVFEKDTDNPDAAVDGQGQLYDD